MSYRHVNQLFTKTITAPAAKAEVVPATKTPEHKITIKEIAAFALQDSEGIVKSSKWSVEIA
jgi:hypothetical protein